MCLFGMNELENSCKKRMIPIFNHVLWGIKEEAFSVLGRRWPAVFVVLTVTSASAQQAVQNMQAGLTAAQNRNQQMQSLQSQDYTFKKGDFRLLITPSLSAQYNDNINLANTNALDDFIATPSVDITASYPLTEKNLLYLDLSVGYNWYIKHSRYSAFALNSSSGTGLSFDIVIKDFTINLHNWISYSQGASQIGLGANSGNGFTANNVNGSIANSANYGTFQNTAGLSGTWDLNQVTLSAGYDHQNVLSTSSQFNDINHSAELFFVRGGARVHPQLTAGLETTAGLTRYDQDVLNDNDAYTVGPYVEFTPSKFFALTVRGGYQTYQFQNSSSTIQTGNQDGWYAGVSISHAPADFVKYSLDAGREVQLGTVSDLIEDWYVRPNVTWSVIKGLDIVTYFFYEHGNQGIGSTGSLSGFSNSTFNWYGGGFSLQHPITRQLSLGLTYQITTRSTDTPNDEYLQNIVALQLTYHPK